MGNHITINEFSIDTATDVVISKEDLRFLLEKAKAAPLKAGWKGQDIRDRIRCIESKLNGIQC